MEDHRLCPDLKFTALYGRTDGESDASDCVRDQWTFADWILRFSDGFLLSGIEAIETGGNGAVWCFACGNPDQCGTWLSLSETCRTAKWRECFVLAESLRGRRDDFRDERKSGHKSMGAEGRTCDFLVQLGLYARLGAVCGETVA